MDVFNTEQVAKFLWNKRVVVIGDSIQRSIYKDIIRLLVADPTSTYLTNQHLKTKGELEFLGDKLLQGGQLGEMKNGISYREVRQFNNGSTVIRFYFVTRCYSDYTKSILHGIKCMRPHAIIMNSCLWDLHRYGLYGPLQYVNNMHKLMIELTRVIPSDAVFIWNATLPLDSKCKGGFLLPYFESVPAQEIVEANFVAADIVRSYGFLFLDLYSVLVHRVDLRESDGIHWNALANRIITSHVLILLSYAWNLPIPRPKIQDPRVLHPHSVVSSNNSLAHSTGNHPQMRADSRHLDSIPTVHDPSYGRPQSDFSNSLILKNIENSTHVVKENLSRDSFPLTGNPTSYPAENVALMRHHRPPVSPLDKLFIHPPPPAENLTLMRHVHHTPLVSPLHKLFIHPPPPAHMTRTSFASDRLAVTGSPTSFQGENSALMRHVHLAPSASPLDKLFLHPTPPAHLSHTTPPSDRYSGTGSPTIAAENLPLMRHAYHIPPVLPLHKLIHPPPRALYF